MHLVNIYSLHIVGCLFISYAEDKVPGPLCNKIKKMNLEIRNVINHAFLKSPLRS